MAIPARVKHVFLGILFILSSINFTKTTLEIIDNSKRLDGLSEEVEMLESQKSDLEESVSYKQTEAYIEEKARNDLSLIKPGEKVYIIPDSLKEGFEDKTVLGVTSINLEGDSNLKLWLDLFL